MATEQLLCFPGWEALKAMDAEEVKKWIISKEFASDNQYVAVVEQPAAVQRERGREGERDGPRGRPAARGAVTHALYPL